MSEDAVSKLLTEKGVAFKASGKSYIIRCLNPEHEDNDPSCRVDKLTGVAHCFSCRWKANLFKYYGVFTNNSSVKIQLLKTKIKQIMEYQAEPPFPEGYAPITQSYRNISVRTLKRFEAFYTDREEKWQDRIIFPVRDVTGKIVSFIGRHMMSNGNPRYFISPSGRPLPLYPTILPEGSTSIVLVEGIFDMLNLQDSGVTNAVCAFGTSTLTEKTVADRMLPYKVQGIQKIYLMFDGDKPGRDAASSLKPLLEAEDFVVEIVNLEDGTDPGVLSHEDIESLKEYIT